MLFQLYSILGTTIRQEHGYHHDKSNKQRAATITNASIASTINDAITIRMKESTKMFSVRNSMNR